MDLRDPLRQGLARKEFADARAGVKEAGIVVERLLQVAAIREDETGNGAVLQPVDPKSFPGFRIAHLRQVSGQKNQGFGHMNLLVADAIARVFQRFGQVIRDGKDHDIGHRPGGNGVGRRIEWQFDDDLAYHV